MGYPIFHQLQSSSPSFARQDARQRQIVKPSAPYESIIYPVQRKSKKQWLYASKDNKTKTPRQDGKDYLIFVSCLAELGPGLKLETGWTGLDWLD